MQIHVVDSSFGCVKVRFVTIFVLHKEIRVWVQYVFFRILSTDYWTRVQTIENKLLIIESELRKHWEKLQKYWAKTIEILRNTAENLDLKREAHCRQLPCRLEAAEVGLKESVGRLDNVWGAQISSTLSPNWSKCKDFLFSNSGISKWKWRLARYSSQLIQPHKPHLKSIWYRKGTKFKKVGRKI